REPSACSLSCGGRAAKPNLDEVCASLTGQRIGGLIVSTDPFIYDQRDRIIASAGMIEIVSGDADLLSAAELLAYPSRACARGPREVQIFPYFLHKEPAPAPPRRHRDRREPDARPPARSRSAPLSCAAFDVVRHRPRPASLRLSTGGKGLRTLGPAAKERPFRGPPHGILYATL